MRALFLRAAGGVQSAFLDGDHSKGGLADLQAVEPVLQVGSFVVLHDTFPEVCSWHGPVPGPLQLRPDPSASNDLSCWPALAAWPNMR